jgi:hypothetical protein
MAGEAGARGDEPAAGEPSPAAYRERLLPLIDRWVAAGTRVAIFGIGPHTEHLHAIVPELSRVTLVAYLDSHPAQQGTRYRGLTVRAPEWAAGQAEVVLCSSFAHELTQLALMDAIPVKTVLSHPVSAAAPAGARAA